MRTPVQAHQAEMPPPAGHEYAGVGVSGGLTTTLLHIHQAEVTGWGNKRGKQKKNEYTRAEDRLPDGSRDSALALGIQGGGPRNAAGGSPSPRGLCPGDVASSCRGTPEYVP